MQSIIQNFAFEGNLVRVIMRAGDPWFVAADVCAALGIKNPRDALDRLDADEKGVGTTDTLGGEQVVNLVCEPGVYRLAFTSRRPEATKFARWVAHEVLVSIRKTGQFGAEPQSTHPETSPLDAPLLHRLQLVRECRCIHGREVAKIMWRKLGLPAVPPPPRTATDEARECLRHILDAGTADGRPVRDLLAQAFEDGEAERLCLLACGIRAYPESDTFAIANHHPWLQAVLKGTAWQGPAAHVRVLRRLSGARPAGPVRMGPLQPRATLFSADALDEFVR